MNQSAKMVRLASEKYTFTVSPALYHFKDFGEIDLRTLTLARADKLFNDGFPYLKLKPPLPKYKDEPKVKKIKTKKEK